MASTYTGAPASRPIDAVRLYLGDTAAPFALTDEEITWLLAAAGDDALAAALAGAGAMSAKFSKLVDATVGDVQKAYSQQYKHFAEVVDRLAGDVPTAAAGEAAPVPWAGGLSYAEREANEADGDLVPAYFTDGMDDRPGTVDRAGYCR